jgi:hypothetical protein
VIRLLRPPGEEQELQGRLVTLQRGVVIAARFEFDDGERWESCRTPEEQAVTGVVVADAPFTLCTPDGAARIISPGTFCFLHRDRPLRTVTRGSGTLVGAWVPREMLDESGLDLRDIDVMLPGGALADGVRAYLTSLLAAPSDPSPASGGTEEILLTEMIFGLLAEAAGRAAESLGDTEGADRALSALRAQHADLDESGAEPAPAGDEGLAEPCPS